MAKTDGESSSPARLHPVYSVSNIQQKVRVLDGTKISYSSWVHLFTLNARGHNVLQHIDGTPGPTKTDSDYASWTAIDAIVLQWIYGTVSDELLPRIMKEGSTALEAWNRLKDIFLNNKGARAASLESEFVNLKLESMTSLDHYCQRLRELSTQLTDVDAPVTEKRLVLQMVRGLPREYDTVVAYINQTCPDFETARSMLELEQHRTRTTDSSPPTTGAALASQTNPPSHAATAWHGPSLGSPHQNQRGPRHRSNRSQRDYRGGSYRAPTTVAPTQHDSHRYRAPSTGHRGRPQLPTPADWQPPPPQWYSPWGPPPCPYPTQPGWQPPFTPWTSATSHDSPSFGRAPASRSGQAHITEPHFFPTDLSSQFQALAIQNQLEDGNWFMDTGASSNLTADSGFSDWDVDSEEH
ncbi:hypothetical protein vseg_011775 [Gypsophila vaccaria]